MSHKIQKKLMSVHPKKYAELAVLASNAAAELLSRLEWVTLKPKLIVDVGCGTCDSIERLQQLYPDATVVGVDIAYSMLQYAQAQVPQSQCICADAMLLPFANGSVDLLFANLVLPWVGDLNTLFKEWKRVLRPEGLLVFTSLGPDTLADWRIDTPDSILPDFIDMHDLGDILVQAKFSDPVMDVDYLTLTYRDVSQLIEELEVTGMIIPEENNLLEYAKNKLFPDDVYHTTYEVIYGHAWGPPETADYTADDEGVVRIPLSHLRRRG